MFREKSFEAFSEPEGNLQAWEDKNLFFFPQAGSSFYYLLSLPLIKAGLRADSFHPAPLLPS